eukprot:scaffold46295_cov62-Phaeocystis_antarctica.AAC.5
MDIAMMLLKGKSTRELDLLERNQPEVFEVFERLGGPRIRATYAPPAPRIEVFEVVERVTGIASGASQLRSSGSSGGSTSCSS